MDRSWVNGRLFSREYINGVKELMGFIQGKFSEDDEILCPCSRCLNQKYLNQDLVEKHILMNGMESTYTRWIHHGESFDVDVVEHLVDVHDNDDSLIHGICEMDDGNCGADRFEEMLQDLQIGGEQNKQGENEDGNNDADSFFKIVMKEAKRHLYPGCTKFSRLSFVVKLLHMKSLHRISNSACTAILKLLCEAFPECNTIPKSYDEAKSLLKELGLGYESIHVCFSNCVLFRKKYAKLDNCPICGLSRWKDAEKKKIPQKVLRHFPLVPRLQRMFITKEAGKAALWHKLKRRHSDKEMRHPADGEAWQDHREYPDFAKDARNIRLGLATDGFNPFSEQNTRYNMWPVFVVPYNLPPWECMEESNFMMALLIPGPTSPGKDFDVFLEPLVEDLLELWKGVSTHDALSGKKFKLRAAVLWCIHDYPALSTLSGRTTKGYFACIHCDKNPLSYGLRSKIGYIGHFRYLTRGHRLRRNNQFAGLHASNDPPSKFTTEELLAELEKVKDVRPGKQQGSRKRKHSEMDRGHVRIWSRVVSLWNLPYWEKLKLRHNLDVMHIEKNICESLIGTILNIIGKTKDTVKARFDLKDLGIMKELQIREDGDSCEMPPARYTLSAEKKKAFCDFLREVKFPDGFASNISRCINAEGTKVQGLKTHDCHILLQRILPAALRGFVDSDVYEAIAELGKFFRELCSRTLNKDVLAEMKKEIPIILVKLEKIFPPAFFDVMVHLAVHLPDDALLRGPVQYGWMYPIERCLYTLKRYVRNRARPEGSIAEAYIADECLTFCSRYMDDVETKFNKEPRNKGFSDEEAYGVDVFGHGVYFTSAPELVYDHNGINQMVWYALNNCIQVEKYVKMFRDELEREGVPNVERLLRQGFETWFRNHIMRLQFTNQEDIDEDLFSLACGPDFRVKKYSSCIVNGVRFNTVDRDKNRKTQNSGVMTQEKPLHPYEEQRLRRCMQNSSRLEQLGIPGLKSMLANICSISHEKETDNNRNREDSEFDYDPSHDDDSEGDMIDDSAKGLKGSDRRPAMLPGGPGGIKRRSKRIYPEQETTRATRSKKSIAQPEANLAPSDICFPDPLPSHVNQVQEVGDDGIVLSDGCTTNGGEGITEPRGGISIGGEGLQERRERGVNMGHGLQRINRSRRGKLPVIIQEGRIRPVVPLVAAKFATECNIAVRNHVPVLKHWKDYKKKPEILTMFEGRLSAKFDIKTSEAPVHNACMQMMKKAIRQQRYRLKKKYFDPFPLHLVSKTSPVKSLNDEQWNDLVELWKTPEKMNTCRRMKDNRANVKFHQTTGSRSYMVHVENLGDKYKDHDPDALDLFKECHYSKKKEGYTPAVQLAITEMENKQSTLVEGEQPKSATEVVADVLVENTKKNQFLQNVGIQAARPRSKVQNIEVQLEAEKRDNADLRGQMAMLSKKVQETEQARIKEEMKRKQAEMDAKLALVLSQIRPN